MPLRRDYRTKQHTFQNCARCSVRVSPNGTLPEAKHSPTVFLGESSGPLVALAVPMHLLLPQLGIRPREGRLPAMGRARVPVVPIDEDSESVVWQDDVRRTPRRNTSVQPEPSAVRMKCPPKQHLRLRADLLSPAQVAPLGGARPARGQRQLSLVRRVSYEVRHTLIVPGAPGFFRQGAIKRTGRETASLGKEACVPDLHQVIASSCACRSLAQSLRWDALAVRGTPRCSSGHP